MESIVAFTKKKRQRIILVDPYEDKNNKSSRNSAALCFGWFSLTSNLSTLTFISQQAEQIAQSSGRSRMCCSCQI